MAGRNKKKRYGRRRARSHGGFVLPAILFAILTPIAVFVAVTVFFKVGTITVTGESGYTDARIIEASGIKIGENMFKFNKFKAINGIFDDMPYIDEIMIRRRLPDNVEINVTKCEPVFTAEGEDGVYLLDIKGKILEKVSEDRRDGHITVLGMTLSDPQVGKYAKFFDEEKEKTLYLLLNTAKKNDILPYVGIINMDKLYSVKLTYKGRFTVNIGSSDQMEKKIRYMLIIAEEKLLETYKGTIDVSDGTTARFIPEN